MGFGIEGKLRAVIHPSFLSYVSLLPPRLLPSSLPRGERWKCRRILWSHISGQWSLCLQEVADGLLQPTPLRLHAPPGLVLKLSLGNIPGKAWDPWPSCSSRRQHQPEWPEAERTRQHRGQGGSWECSWAAASWRWGTFQERKRSVCHPRAAWEAQRRCSLQPSQAARPALTPHWVSPRVRITIAFPCPPR